MIDAHSVNILAQLKRPLPQPRGGMAIGTCLIGGVPTRSLKIADQSSNDRMANPVNERIYAERACCDNRLYPRRFRVKDIDHLIPLPVG